MAQFEFKLPDIGEGVTEGEIVEWHVKVGDVVAEDDAMVEVMTDKATVTIGAPRAGTISDIRFKAGEVAQVGQVIVTIAVGAAAEAPKHEAPKHEPQAASKPAKKDDGPAATAVGDIREGLPGSNFFQTKPAGAGPNGTHPVAPSAKPAAAGLQTIEFFQAKPLATPATRKLAREIGVDLRRVPPSGPQGRTTRQDVKTFGDTAVGTIVAPASSVPSSAPATPAPAAAKSTAIAPALPAQPIVAPSRESAALEERKPFVGIRRKIAQKMQTAKNTAAHFTFVEECHSDDLIAMRERLRPAAAAQGVKLTFLPFIVKAVVAALKKTPVLNSALDETTNELVYRRYYDIGIAAATDSGLMVPVVRNADRLSILELAKEIDRLGEGARAGTLKPDELSGSTFTITSLGKTGGLFATPVLNHPEVGILGVHQMKQKPVVRDNQIVIGNVMLLSLSFDHRIVDGHIGAAFAYDIIGFLENPDRLFLEI